jgi:hypothetical protein
MQAPISSNGMTTPWQLRAFPLFTIGAWILVAVVVAVGVFVLAPTAANYWGGHPKAIRDAATAGSALQSQLALLSSMPRWLEPLTFTAIALFMVGIALEFSSIPGILRNRGKILNICFPLLVRYGAQQAESEGNVQ